MRVYATEGTKAHNTNSFLEKSVCIQHILKCVFNLKNNLLIKYHWKSKIIIK